MTRDEAVRYAFAELHQTFFDELHALMAKVDARARAQEREACAKVCDGKVDAEYATGKVDHNEMSWSMACAIAIRARGNNEQG